jgi:hypothetical protein
MRLRQANRLVADLDRVLTADDIMSLEPSDVLASRVFGKTKWLSSRFPYLRRPRTPPGVGAR